MTSLIHGIRSGSLPIAATFALVGLLAASATAQYEGPAYPPPGGVTFSASGTGEGDPGGLNFHFSNVLALPFVELYWGPASATAITVTMQDGPQVLGYDPATSGLPGFARWKGVVGWDDPFVSGPALYYLPVRFTLTQTAPAGYLMTAPAPLAGSGALVDVLAGGSGFVANLLFEVEYPTGSWLPINLLKQEPGNFVKTSFFGGFFWKPSDYAADVVDLGPGCGPEVLTSTAPVLGGTADLALTGAPTSAQGLLYLGLPIESPIVVPPCTLYMHLTQSLPIAFTTDGSGAWIANGVPVPSTTSLAGLDLRLQAFVKNLAAPTGLGFDVSNGLEVTIGY